MQLRVPFRQLCFIADFYSIGHSTTKGIIRDNFKLLAAIILPYKIILYLCVL